MNVDMHPFYFVVEGIIYMYVILHKYFILSNTDPVAILICTEFVGIIMNFYISLKQQI